MAIKNVTKHSPYLFLKLSIGFAIAAAILREVDIFLCIVCVLFSGYCLIRS